MAGPLAGFRIVDLTTMLSGPWATSILGDQGADVIKVEMPVVGDHTRSLGNRSGGLSADIVSGTHKKLSPSPSRFLIETVCRHRHSVKFFDRERNVDLA